jgi:hypothetical protein
VTAKAIWNIPADIAYNLVYVLDEMEESMRIVADNVAA